MQGGGLVLSPGIHRPSGGKHEADGFVVVGLRRVGELASIFLRKPLDQAGICREQRLGSGLVAEITGQNQLQLSRAALHEQTKHFLLTEFAGHQVRGLVIAQSPDVDAAAGARIPFREVRFGDAHANAGRVGVEVLAHEFEVA
jgi:hypothetical protein